MTTPQRSGVHGAKVHEAASVSPAGRVSGVRSRIPRQGSPDNRQAEPSSKSWARRSGHGRGTGTPWGTRRRKSTRRATARHGSSRSDHDTAADAASSMAAPLLRRLDALCHSGDHARQQQLTQPRSPWRERVSDSCAHPLKSIENNGDRVSVHYAQAAVSVPGARLIRNGFGPVP
jgi:hypothetical protein